MADSLCAQGRDTSVVMNDKCVLNLEVPDGLNTVTCDSFKSSLFFFNANSELCSNFGRNAEETAEASATLDICRVMEASEEDFSSLFKTICAESEEDNCSKKRCTDRYDSSESSDSGVATLSCSESSGSSSSDITDPGSPLSSSSSCECSDSPTPSKMAPNSAFPWNKRPSTEDMVASFDLKRLKVDEESESVLDNNNCQVAKNGNYESGSDSEFKSSGELDEMVLQRVKCCFQNPIKATTTPLPASTPPMPQAQVRKTLFTEVAESKSLRPEPRTHCKGPSLKRGSSPPKRNQVQNKNTCATKLPQVISAHERTSEEVIDASEANKEERVQIASDCGSNSSANRSVPLTTVATQAKADSKTTNGDSKELCTAKPTAPRAIPADILSKTLVIKCENLSNLTQSQMPVKCGNSVFQIEPRTEAGKLISDLKSDAKHKCVPRTETIRTESKVTAVTDSRTNSSNSQFRVPNPSVQTRRKLRSSRNCTTPSSSLSRIAEPEHSTNPFAFSRNFPGAYLLSPTYINGHVVTDLPSIPLVPGGLSRYGSTGSLKLCNSEAVSDSPCSDKPGSERSENGTKNPSSRTSYLTLRGVVSVPFPIPSRVEPSVSTESGGAGVRAPTNSNSKTETGSNEPGGESKENLNACRPLPLSIYSRVSEPDTRQDSSSSSSSLEYSDADASNPAPSLNPTCSSNSSCQIGDSTELSSSATCPSNLISICSDPSESNASTESTSSAPILSVPQNIRFPKKEEKPSDTWLPEDIVCRWIKCSEEFSSNAALVEHLQTIHVKEQTSAALSSCFWEGCKCYGKPATNKGYLENHVITHAGKKPFSCIFQRCGLSFSSQGALARHVGQHFMDDNAHNNAKRTPDSPLSKPTRRKGRKNRFLKRPSSRVVDFFDSSVLERLNEKFATDTLRRTQGIFNENDNGFSITLLSQVCAKRIEPDGTVRYLLRWFPRGIVGEEWLTKDKIKGHQFVDMRTLPEEEKEICLEYIFQGNPQPGKASRKSFGNNQNCS